MTPRLRLSPEDAALADRARALLPAYRIKWCCIMLNDFLPLGGARRGFAEGVTMGHQLLVQLESVAITIVWSGVVAFIGYKLADMTVGLRVPEEQEREGLDVNSHGENAYNA